VQRKAEVCAFFIYEPTLEGINEQFHQQQLPILNCLKFKKLLLTRNKKISI